MIKIENIEVSKVAANSLLKEKWNFDWYVNRSQTSKKLAAIEDDQIQGLIEFDRIYKDRYNFIYLLEIAPKHIKQNTDYAGKLLASVALDSFNEGFQGFMLLISKTIRADYYVKKYGAIKSTNERLIFDFEASKMLINKYLGGN